MEKNQDLVSKEIETLFINAHAVKATARTLHLRGLTEVFHHLEVGLSHILRQGLDVPSGQRTIGSIAS